MATYYTRTVSDTHIDELQNNKNNKIKKCEEWEQRYIELEKSYIVLQQSVKNLQSIIDNIRAIVN